MTMQPLIERILDALDYAYGGDMDEHLGPEWREVFAEVISQQLVDGSGGGGEVISKGRLYLDPEHGLSAQFDRGVCDA